MANLDRWPMFEGWSAPAGLPRMAPRRAATRQAPKRSELTETLLRFESAHKRRSITQMRDCFHDEALMESVASSGTVLGPDETAAALRSAFRNHVYGIGDWRYEAIAADVVLSITGARQLRPGARVADGTVYRLISGRDGLIWRVKLFPSRAAALEHLARHGRGLGL